MDRTTVNEMVNKLQPGGNGQSASQRRSVGHGQLGGQGPSGPAGRPGPRPEEMLRAVGLKVTAVRVALIDLISRRAQHMTADEITAALHAEGLPVDRVTIYRNVERMMQEGLLMADLQPGRALKVALGPRPGRVHHHHIVCDSCGRVTPTAGCYLAENWEAIRADMLKTTGYELGGHLMQFTGTCPECSRSQTEAEEPLGPPASA